VSAAAPSTGVIESEVRRQARKRAEKQLEWADQESKHRLAECIEPIQGFFSDAEQGIPGFVDEALGWRSKWNFVLDRMPFTATGRHEAFMHEAFLALLDLLGPRTGLPTFLALCPEMARGEMQDLLRRYRRVWKRKHRLPVRVLHWHRAGAVWAADFA